MSCTVLNFEEIVIINHILSCLSQDKVALKYKDKTDLIFYWWTLFKENVTLHYIVSHIR